MNNQDLHSIHIPVDKLKAREKVAIYQAKKKRQLRRNTSLSLLAACTLSLTILGSGFVFTGMAQALSTLPFVGPIYEQFNEIASATIKENKLATAIDKKDTHHGFSMTVKEAAYDGGRMMMTIIYESPHKLSMDEEKVGYSFIKINNQDPNVAIGSATTDQLDDHTIVEYHQFAFKSPTQYGNEINVSMNGENLFGQRGKWEVSFPLKKVKGDHKEFQPSAAVKTLDGQYSISSKSVTFSPLSTRIDLNVMYPAILDTNDHWPMYDYMVMDSNGRKYDALDIQEGTSGAYGHDIVIILPPMKEVPSSLTVLPRYGDKQGHSLTKEDLILNIKLH